MLPLLWYWKGMGLMGHIDRFDEFARVEIVILPDGTLTYVEVM